MLTADRVRDYILDESGQSTTEFILLVGLISIPIWVLFNALIRTFLDSFIGAVIGSFTRG